jgi:hypothetical protein
VKRFLALTAALVLWTLLSFGWLTFFSDGNVCNILQVVPPDGSYATPRLLTQAEMDAQIASRCGTPRPNQLLVIGGGYLAIVVAGLYVTAGRRETTVDP